MPMLKLKSQTLWGLQIHFKMLLLSYHHMTTSSTDIHRKLYCIAYVLLLSLYRQIIIAETSII